MLYALYFIALDKLQEYGLINEYTNLHSIHLLDRISSVKTNITKGEYYEEL